MTQPTVQQVVLTEPLVIYGKHFRGDYARSPQYITEVMDLLKQAGIDYQPNKALGIYYDNPQQTKAEELRCFQGVFVSDEAAAVPPALEKFVLTGKYLYISITGEPMRSIFEAYQILFDYIGKNNVHLKSPAGYQVSTFDDGVMTTEVYMEPA